MFVTQRSTSRKIPLVEADVEFWKDQTPTLVATFLPVSEGAGTIHGSVFCFWIGSCDITSKGVRRAIEDFVSNQDVVGLRFIRAVPEQLHPVVSVALLGNLS